MGSQTRVRAMRAEAPRAKGGRAPDVFTPGGWVPMAAFRAEAAVDFAMVSLRRRREQFKSRTLLGYASDWPTSYEEIRPYYREAEQAMKVSGPVRYPWGPAREPYPYRPHEVNAAGLVLARGAEK